jgi:hypothetical protein
MYNTGLACGVNVAPFIALPFMIMFIAMGGLFAVSVLLFKIFLWWRVFSKTGYSGAFSLLILAPFGTLIMLCVLAFSQWPISKQPKQQV